MTTTHSQPATPPYSGPLDRPSAERLAKANINPATGLATDYLNHFNEAIMLLELVATMPECLPDLMEWRPMTYQDHFAGSAFRDRELAVAAYDAADPVARTDLERLADAMTTILLATRDAMAASEGSATSRTEAARAMAALRPLVAQAGAVINGRASSQGAQGAIDAVFGR
jgi:hypothetical protein